MHISHKLFAAAVAENSDVQRPRLRAEKPVIVDLTRRAEPLAWSKERSALAQPMMPAQGWFTRANVSTLGETDYE